MHMWVWGLLVWTGRDWDLSCACVAWYGVYWFVLGRVSGEYLAGHRRLWGLLVYTGNTGFVGAGKTAAWEKILTILGALVCTSLSWSQEKETVVGEWVYTS